MHVTYKMLDDMDACFTQLDLFHRNYPNGVAVTIENLREAKRRGLDIVWFALKVSKEFKDADDVAYGAHNERRNSAYRAHLDRCASATDEYISARSYAEYDRLRKEAWNEYAATITPEAIYAHLIGDKHEANSSDR